MTATLLFSIAQGRDISPLRYTAVIKVQTFW